jgi:hypothetical protein
MSETRCTLKNLGVFRNLTSEKIDFKAKNCANGQKSSVCLFHVLYQLSTNFVLVKYGLGGDLKFRKITSCNDYVTIGAPWSDHDGPWCTYKNLSSSFRFHKTKARSTN